MLIPDKTVNDPLSEVIVLTLLVALLTVVTGIVPDIVKVSNAVFTIKLEFNTCIKPTVALLVTNLPVPKFLILEFNIYKLPDELTTNALLLDNIILQPTKDVVPLFAVPLLNN
jgi:hypothetical protein